MRLGQRVACNCIRGSSLTETPQRDVDVSEGAGAAALSFARDRALEEHLTAHPELRPTLAELTQAVAEIDHNPLADEPKLIERAAREIVRVKPDADPDDVLVWALSRQAATG